MARSQRSILRYSDCFKQKVVNEIEQEGLTLSQAARRYGIKGSETIQKWIAKLGKNHLLNKIVRVETRSEKDRIRELEAENTRLKLALADAVLHRDVLEKVVQLAEEHYQADLKKNSGKVLSGKSGRKKGIQ
jgi:transposase